ncbi:enoyl-CoA hydratase/isomerase family protein [Nocardia sp. NPDC052278]|uniref:enoyl-CoA hydratase/isomerase family protein n=1 Tax=unclassified Nocardia TaxID=2637762 RepID=UPI003681BCBC
MNIPLVLQRQQTALCGLLDHVLWVRLNRQHSGNMVDRKLAGELRRIWDWLRDEPDVPTVVITGVGPETFCLGLDKLAPPTEPFTPRHCGVGQRIVAAVNGSVCAEGFTFLDEADEVVASAQALFSRPALSRLAAPGAEPPAWLEAADWSGYVRAEEAARAGLVHEVVPLVMLKTVARRDSEIESV